MRRRISTEGSSKASSSYSTFKHVHLFEYFIGDSRLNKFVCGGRDGCIRLWDLRHYRVPSATVSHASKYQDLTDRLLDDLFSCRKGRPSEL